MKYVARVCAKDSDGHIIRSSIYFSECEIKAMLESWKKKFEKVWVEQMIDGRFKKV